MVSAMSDIHESAGRFGYVPSVETSCYTLREWAWEFLRQNKEFQEAWQEARKNFTVVDDRPKRRTIIESNRSSKLSQFSLRYSSLPFLDAQAAKVIWTPDATNSVLRMYAICRRKDLSSPSLFRPENIACSMTRLIDANGIQHVLFQEEGRSLQLQVAGAPLEGPVYLFAETPVTHEQDVAYLKAVHRFENLRTTGHLLEGDYRSDRYRPRLSEVLDALKLSHDRSTHRAIATKLYGGARVDKEWADTRSGMRDHVRRLIQRGRDLVSGEYRNLLS
jgi:hypothetical protein